MQNEEQPDDRPDMVEQLVPAQVPRRFPVGTMLLLVTVFAIVLSVARTLGATPGLILLIAGWVVLIALAQVLLFHGQKPREASIYGGAAAWFVLGVATILVRLAWQGAGTQAFTEIVFFASLRTILGAIFLGPALGYATGCALAGVFLVLDRIRTGRWNQVRNVETPVTAVPSALFASRIGWPQPVLETERLRLRPFDLADAAEVQRLAGDAEVASTTFRIPHPYEDGMAEAWISSLEARCRSGQEVVFAIARKEDGQLLGAAGLSMFLDQGKAELGYWIGRPYWNRGYATESAAKTLEFGFQQLGLISVFAHHMVRNPASGRVMQKIGMQHKHRLREFIEKDGVREDCHWYEIMHHQWNAVPSREPIEDP